MSHSLIIDELPLAPSPCVSAPTGLQVGQRYRVNGTTQGLLTFDYIAEAISPTQLSSEVRVIVAGAPATQDGWRGTIDYADCQLTYLENNYGNKINEKGNIGTFPWLSANYTDNYAAPGSTFTAGPDAGEIVRRNYVTGTLNLAAVSNTGTGVTNNVIGGFVTLANTGTTAFTQNTIDGSFNASATAVNINISTTFAARGSNINHNSPRTLVTSFLALNGFGTISTNVGAVGTGNITVTQSVIDNGTININAATYPANISINTVFLSSGAQIIFLTAATWANTGAISINRATLSAQSTLIMNGGAAPDTTITVNNVTGLSGSQINIDPGSNDVQRVTVEAGTLNTAGFNILDSRLQGATSTLIADASFAQKSGYVGVLP